MFAVFRKRGWLRPAANFIVRLKVPKISDSITEVTLVRYFKQVGDYVGQDEELAEVESHKGSMNVRAEQAGKITKHIAELNKDIEVGADLVEVDETAKAGQPAAGSKPHSVPEHKDESQTSQKTESSSTGSAPKTVPPAPSTAPQPDHVSPPPLSAQHSGAAAETARAPPVLQPPAAPKPMPRPSKVVERAETRERMSRIRRTTAERLKQSQNTYASVCTFQEVDMSRVMETRKELGEDFKTRTGAKLGLMSFFVKACATALVERPLVNAVIDDENQEVLFRNYVDISVAVSGPRGLLVPVLRDCQALSFGEIELRLVDLAARAKSNAITLEDMTGGTFTISNGGVFGSMLSVPIINPPQSAVLGMHSIVTRPVVREGEIVARPIMYVSLSYDHRLLDGREGVGFLRRVADLLEDPRKLLFELS